MRTEFLLAVGIIGFVLLILNAIFLGIIFFMRRKMAAVSQVAFDHGDCADVKSGSAAFQ